MNLLIKDTLEKFFNNHDVIIEDKNEKTWNLDGISISLKQDHLKYFVLLTSNKDGIDWFIHFENHSTTPFTSEEKYTLYLAVADIIEDGDVVTTEGGVTPGGISAIKNLSKYGFQKIGENKGKNVYWSENLMDYTKFNKWLINAKPTDYVVKDKTKFLTLDNTAPIVWIMRKTI